MIWSLILFFNLWYAGGFDWIQDCLDCFNYERICHVCEKYVAYNIDFGSLERWQFSMLNKIKIEDPSDLNEQYYLDIWEIVLLYKDEQIHQGMFSFMYNEQFIQVDKTGFWKIKLKLR